MMLKKTLLSLSLSLLAGGSIAGGMGSRSGDCERYWDFGIEGLYLKPQYSGQLAYRGYYTFPSSGGVTFWETQYVPYTKDWQYGIAIEGSYHLSKNDDYNLNWGHYKSKNSRTWYDGFALDNNLEPVTSLDSYTDLTTYWDQVNLERGHKFSYKEFSFRVHSGVNFSNLKTQSDDSRYRRPPLNDNIFEQEEYKFFGVGPRIGVDGYYQLSNYIYLLAKGASSLLVGQREYSFVGRVPDFPTVGDNNNGKTKVTTVVPEIEGSLGAGVAFDNSYGRYSIEVAFHGLMYWGNIQHRPLVTNSNVWGSDLKLYGTGLKLHWAGEVA